LCRVVESEIVFEEAGFRVPLRSCASYKSILEWVWHLSQQSWASRSLLACFVDLAATHHNLDLRVFGEVRQKLRRRNVES